MDVEQAIRGRRTWKVLADPDQPWPAEDVPLDALLELASCAPFHYPCDPSHAARSGASPVPWRFHVLQASACRRLLHWIQLAQLSAGKIANMLAAADALILVTWLPDPGETFAFQGFASTQRNMEHLAASAAATQNLLVGAAGRGWENYWSSGGILRSEELYAWLKIPETEVLLAAVFLFPQDTQGVPTKGGANRHKQGDPSGWRRNVALQGEPPIGR